MKVIIVSVILSLACLGVACTGTHSFLDPHTYKEGRPYLRTITDPYEWAMIQLSDGSITYADMNDRLALLTELREAHADLDGDGKPELLIGTDTDGRLWEVLVFTQVTGGYRYVGSFTVGHLTVVQKGHGILVFEPCGGHFGYIRFYRQTEKGFICTSSESIVAGDGAPDENNLKLERLFPEQSILRWSYLSNHAVQHR